MNLSDVGVAGQQVDLINGGDVTPSGRLLSTAELQQQYRNLRASRLDELRQNGTQPGADSASTPLPAAQQRPHTSPAPANRGPHTSAAAAEDRPHTSPARAEDRPHTPADSAAGERLAASGAHALGADWVAVVSAHSGAGASCVALALADTLADERRPCRLIEAAHPARSGLVAAATAELGTDPTGDWRRGSRRLTTVYRRAAGTAPGGWPEPVQDAITIVDLGLPAPANIARLIGDRPCIVLVCRVTVPGLRLTEQAIAELAGTSVVLAAVGPSRWPGAVTASIGPRVRELRDGRRLATFPDDRHLQVTGPTNSPLPKSVSAAGRELLGLIDAARSGGAGAPPTLTAQSTPRQRGKR